jgi:hypothetical protein
MFSILHNKFSYHMVAVALAMQLVNACAPFESSPTTEVQASTAMPTLAPTEEIIPTPSLTPTVDHFQEWLDWLATQPREMESYGRIYDPVAVASLPPPYSVNMVIWGEHLPLQVIDHIPEFIDSPPLLVSHDLTAALARAGCTRDGRTINCIPGGPWQEFGCESYIMPDAGSTGLAPGITLLAQCLTPEIEEQERSSYLYRRGCAFRKEVSYILEEDNSYHLASTPAELQAIWQPIESEAEELAYSVLLTGLSVTHHFAAQPELLYFKDPLEGTRVSLGDDHYLINLFQYQTCLCEPWVNSEVFVSVNQRGELTWLSALPISMTIGFSCAD